jgi:nucleotide-binding universal stress UspA family protein
MAESQRAIVCGVDGSRASRDALHVARDLARRLGARLVVAHVVHAPVSAPIFVSAGRTALASSPAAEIEAGERLLDRLLEDDDLDEVGRRVVYGFPAARLADVADDEGAELVVVGSRGRGAFRTAFLGSVSSELVGVARCPVLVVPPRAGRDDHSD